MRAVVAGAEPAAEFVDDSTVVIALGSATFGVSTGLDVAGSVAGAVCPVIV